jgi:hypothetical protein
MSSSSLESKERDALVQMRALFAGKADPLDRAFPLDDSCFLRYLRARNFDVTKAQVMLTNTLAWRKEFGVANIHSKANIATISKENSTGKTYVRGFDSQGHAIMYMRPKYENTYDHDGNCLHLVYNLERAIACMNRRHEEQGQGPPPATGAAEKIALLVEYEGYSIFNAPPMRTSRAILDILQNHYPERLYKAYLIRPPWIFSSFWTMISPFIDKVTKAKINMISASTGPEIVRKIGVASEGTITADMLELDIGGTLDSTTAHKDPRYGADTDGMNGKGERVPLHPGFSSARYLGRMFKTEGANTGSGAVATTASQPVSTVFAALGGASGAAHDVDFAAQQVFGFDYERLHQSWDV